MRIFKCLIIGIACLVSNIAMQCLASPWTNFVEYPSDPIYNPYGPGSGTFYPFVIFDENKFDFHGASYYYKMWHQTTPSGSIAISYSNDGINWTYIGETNIIADSWYPLPIDDKQGIPYSDYTNAYHQVVVYNENGMLNPDDGYIYYYRIWFWNGVVGTDATCIHYSFSNDGVNWITPLPCGQDAFSPIVTGISGTYLYHLYGPGYVIFNPSATSTPGQPYTYPYVMFYDIASESEYPMSGINSVETIFLAYSEDGITWTRYGSATAPMILLDGAASGEWDGDYAYHPAVFKLRGVYHMYYCGSNSTIDPATTRSTAHGIGHAYSTDGVNWTRDADNPVFSVFDGVPWRSYRCYTPTIVFKEACQIVVQMWFNGAIRPQDSPETNAIGYATLLLPCDKPSCSKACLLPNKLSLIKKYSHGAPVQSVAWLVNDSSPWVLAAIGGYTSSIDGDSVRMYVMNVDCTLEQPDAVDSIHPTDCVYGVDWCSIKDQADNNLMYLAIVGAPDAQGNALWIYQYNPNGYGLEFVAAYPYQGTLYAVAWLCKSCANGMERYLVVGGDPVNGISGKLLQFNPEAATNKITLIEDIYHDATIYSASWCQKDSGRPLLALGGKTEQKHNTNLRIFSFDCNNWLIPMCGYYYEGETIRSLQWCCENDNCRSACAYLLVGGDPIKNEYDPYKLGVNEELLVLNPRTELLCLLGYQRHQEKIFSVGWIPGCSCTQMSAAGGCAISQICSPNIFIDAIEKKALPLLVTKSNLRFDETITSTAWALFDGCAFLLVGSEDSKWFKGQDPLCANGQTKEEIALYKGVFCQGKESFVPESICQRELEIRNSKPIDKARA